MIHAAVGSLFCTRLARRTGMRRRRCATVRDYLLATTHDTMPCPVRNTLSPLRNRDVVPDCADMINFPSGKPFRFFGNSYASAYVASNGKQLRGWRHPRGARPLIPSSRCICRNCFVWCRQHGLRVDRIPHPRHAHDCSFVSAGSRSSLTSVDDSPPRALPAGLTST